jgi:hypothetical protein
MRVIAPSPLIILPDGRRRPARQPPAQACGAATSNVRARLRRGHVERPRTLAERPCRTSAHACGAATPTAGMTWLAEVHPPAMADLIIDNSDFANPVIASAPSC